MEPEAETQAQQNGGGKAAAAGGGGQSNYLCRQSSTRWTPTTDQIKILKDLYYKEGIRSPNADQIQKISAQLRKFGKIEGKNVFYWFQNHKARERQKKRFSLTAEQQLLQMPPSNLIYPNYTPGPPGITYPSSSSGPAMVSLCGYPPITMDTNYLKECGVPGCTSGGVYGYPSQSLNQWSNNGVMNPYSHQPYALMESARSASRNQDYYDEEGNKSPELETLPLFPVHGEDSSVTPTTFFADESDSSSSNFNNNACHWLNQQASLELSLNLNSYADHPWPNY